MFSIMIVKNLASAGGNNNFLYQGLLCEALQKLEKMFPTLSHRNKREKIKVLQKEELHFKHFFNEYLEQCKVQTQ